MKLYTSLTSPFGRKARVVLAEKRIDHQLEEIDLVRDEALITSLNPLGKIPVLVLDDGRVLFESSLIVDYLEHASPLSKLMPSERRPMLRTKAVEALADGIADAVVLITIELRQEPAQQSSAWIEKQQGKVLRGLSRLDADLDGKRWYIDEHYSIADIAVGCMLGYIDLRQPGLDWRSACPNLVRLYDALMMRESFRSTAPQSLQPQQAVATA
ncbi:glutathione S-transferase N-terminal domain-containing protein [Chitinibacteraceae bacterium HSL-7]